MKNKIISRGKLFTYTGTISYPDGSPTLIDMAVALGRICRYAGNGVRWWPVILHTFVVCDLLPDEFKVDGLLHDGPECITNDIPKPVKTDEIEAVEDIIHRRLYKSLKLPFPTAKQYRIVKKADVDALCGEVYTVGTSALQTIYPRAPRAEKLVMKYLALYPPMECITPDGRAPMEFLRRFRVYSDLKMRHAGKK